MNKEESEVGIMPSVDLVEQERIAYINEMKEYLKTLKGMERGLAKKKSLENLKRSGIIDENGEFTEHYKHMRTSMKKR